MYALFRFPAFFKIISLLPALCFLNIENISGNVLFRIPMFILFVIIVIAAFYISGFSPYVKTSSADYLKKAV